MEEKQCEICGRPITENAEHNPLCFAIMSMQAEIRELRGDRPKSEEKPEPDPTPPDDKPERALSEERSIPRP